MEAYGDTRGRSPRTLKHSKVQIQVQVVGPARSQPGNIYLETRRSCSGCGRWNGMKEPRYMVCAACKEEAYCSESCQRKDWKLHKHRCRTKQTFTELQHKRFKIENKSARWFLERVHLLARIPHLMERFKSHLVVLRLEHNSMHFAATKNLHAHSIETYLEAQDAPIPQFYVSAWKRSHRKSHAIQIYVIVDDTESHAICYSSKRIETRPGLWYVPPTGHRGTLSTLVELLNVGFTPTRSTEPLVGEAWLRSALVTSDVVETNTPIEAHSHNTPRDTFITNTPI